MLFLVTIVYFFGSLNVYSCVDKELQSQKKIMCECFGINDEDIVYCEKCKLTNRVSKKYSKYCIENKCFLEYIRGDTIYCFVLKTNISPILNKVRQIEVIDMYDKEKIMKYISDGTIGFTNIAEKKNYIYKFVKQEVDTKTPLD